MKTPIALIVWALVSVAAAWAVGYMIAMIAAPKLEMLLNALTLQ